MTGSSEPTRELSVRDMAWLTRVAPNNVKNWFDDDRYPARADGRERKTTTYEDLQEFCSRAGKAAPLPQALLYMTAEEVAALLDANSAVDGTELSRSLGRERHLRGSLRNLLAARTHQRQEAAMADLAVRELLDLAERAADEPAASDGPVPST